MSIFFRPEKGGPCILGSSEYLHHCEAATKRRKNHRIIGYAVMTPRYWVAYALLLLIIVVTHTSAISLNDLIKQQPKDQQERLMREARGAGT